MRTPPSRIKYLLCHPFIGHFRFLARNPSCFFGMMEYDTPCSKLPKISHSDPFLLATALKLCLGPTEDTPPTPTCGPGPGRTADLDPLGALSPLVPAADSGVAATTSTAGNVPLGGGDDDASCEDDESECDLDEDMMIIDSSE